VAAKKECPGFDPELLPWIDFGGSNNLVYVNQSNDTLTYKLFALNSSIKYTVRKDTNDPCHSYCLCRASDSLGNQLIYSIDKFRKETRLSISFSREINNIFKYDNLYLNFKKIEKETQSETINGINYNDCLILKCNSTENASANDIDKCIIVKGYGLMQVFENSGIVWTRQL
jgi:hypothetical protein